MCNGGVQQTETEYGPLGSRIEETIIVEEGKAEERKETLQRDRERVWGVMTRSSAAYRVISKARCVSLWSIHQHTSKRGTFVTFDW